MRKKAKNSKLQAKQLDQFEANLSKMRKLLIRKQAERTIMHPKR